MQREMCALLLIVLRY